jgi:hypothetical protein
MTSEMFCVLLWSQDLQRIHNPAIYFVDREEAQRFADQERRNYPSFYASQDTESYPRVVLCHDMETG